MPLPLVFSEQIPDAKTGSSSLGAVLVDEEAVGSVDASGCGAKILQGDGAIERFLRGEKLMDFKVSYTMLSDLFTSTLQ